MSKTVCFTGHRVIPPDQLEELKELLANEVYLLTLGGFTNFRTGGALGFDTLAALAVLRQREESPQISLSLVLPFERQAQRWPPGDRETYDHIRSRADSVTYTAREYHPDCFLRRNRALVDGSHLCDAYLLPRVCMGGTLYTVLYAQDQGVRVHNLWEMMERLKHLDRVMGEEERNPPEG